MYNYKSVITNVVDGDTFDMDVDLGFKVHKHVRVRLLDIDTPEKRGDKEKELGNICTEYARQNFLGKTCNIKAFKDKDAKTDSFGRYLVYCYPDGFDDSVVGIYNKLGINKKCVTYSDDKVRKLGEEIGYYK